LTAKAGVPGPTKAMARKPDPDRLQVNAICPCFCATDIAAGRLMPEMQAQILACIPMVRVGVAEDVAGCALFLASEQSGYCTGTEADVNGGALIHRPGRAAAGVGARPRPPSPPPLQPASFC
jgi:NAD(P)-dependent dehydrogenase (short-subunit alcohol dehydrogenase family)